MHFPFDKTFLKVFWGCRVSIHLTPLIPLGIIVGVIPRRYNEQLKIIIPLSDYTYYKKKENQNIFIKYLNFFYNNLYSD